MNQLASEKSPYLLQHADNPVDWHPWTAAVFARARDENRLVFLSIGYSTCHWCHVMAHECFEDEEVAALLNRDYLAVKVDREERPDIDQVYMEACQRLTRGGGWPLTIIMTPEGEPFYAATYVPKHGRHGRPGLMELLPWVSEKWRSDPQPLRHAAQELVQMMRTGRDSGDRTEVDLVLQDQAALLLKRSYDQEHGGFGQAPKFPRPHDLTFLLMRHDMTGDAEALSMVEKTLRAMRSGGIYDQVGWGFHRYATDAHWLVPHFEKMLYDQAGLVQAYLDAWQTTGRADYAETVREILAYLARDMTSPEGAFYSAEDADSEGVEGKFYLWTEAEIRALLGDEAEAFCRAYNVRSAGNYHDEVSGRLTGSNILHLGAAADEPAGLAPAGRFPASCERLLAARGQRIRPHLDDKIITAWNGMAISAFAAAGRALGDEALLARARRAADYLLATLRTGEGRLLRSCRLGEPSVGAFAEDYAFTARGLLDLYAADFAPRLLQQAVEFAAVLRNFFQDPASGRLYDAPSDGERLLVRPSSSYDGATPSAAAATLDVFARLFLLTGDASWRNAADLLLGAVSADLARYPAGYTALLQAANWLLRPSREVVIVGRRGDPAAEAMLAVACSCRPRQTVVLFKAQDQADAIEPLAPFTRQMSAASGSASAYLCENFSCSTPTDDPARLRALLEQPL